MLDRLHNGFGSQKSAVVPFVSPWSGFATTDFGSPLDKARSLICQQILALLGQSQAPLEDKLEPPFPNDPLLDHSTIRVLLFRSRSQVPQRRQCLVRPRAASATSRDSLLLVEEATNSATWKPSRSMAPM
jgi:hypothetical protein